MQAARRSGPIGSYLGHALADPEPRSAETAAPRPGAAYPASVVTLAQLSVAHPPALGAGRCLPRTRRDLSPAQCGSPTRPWDRCCLPRARCDLIPTKFGPPTHPWGRCCLPRTRRGLSPARCGPPTRPSGWVLASPHPLVAPARYREVLRARLRH